MLVEGFHLYSMVIKVFGSEESKHLYYYGIGWGCPLVICIISAASAMDYYGEHENCWLSLKNGAIWAFAAPALFVIVVNIGILIAVTRVISRISADNYKVHGDANAVNGSGTDPLNQWQSALWSTLVLHQNEKSKVNRWECLPSMQCSGDTAVKEAMKRSLGKWGQRRREENKKGQGKNAAKLLAWLTAKAVAVLLPILGSSWIFGVLAVNDHAVVFQYMFAIFNSLQVRAAFKHKTKVWSLTSSSIRNINVKPFNSDIMTGNRPGTTPTKMNTWDKSTNSANQIDLSAV
ncbi:hypothetical protein UY3_02466 [Chelonia mydas]|uniref:G-protein coupled receptors family 2 profile 2 domain-containing protein n=1 Tax=Chelonia mydas TaxID=8469 RepID=M7C712_CHEMY|nr:hypothetical protein UY3_02466 [Chelonia mydas]